MSSGASLMLCPLEAGAGGSLAGVVQGAADASNQLKRFNLFLLKEGNLRSSSGLRSNI